MRKLILIVVNREVPVNMGGRVLLRLFEVVDEEQCLYVGGKVKALRSVAVSGNRLDPPLWGAAFDRAMAAARLRGLGVVAVKDG